MKQGRRMKAVLAIVLVTLALVMPLMLTIGAPPIMPTLYFDGMRMKICDDGAVQLFLDVAVEGVNTWSGLSYELTYDKRMLTPSHYDTNEALGSAETDLFFRLDNELYDPALPSPILQSSYRSIINAGSDTRGSIFMEMYLDQEKDAFGDGRLTLENSKLELYEAQTEDGALFYVVNTTETPNDPAADVYTGGAAHGKTVIGTLSFRAEAKDIPAMTALYGEIFQAQNPLGKDGTYLLDFPKDSGGVVTTRAWQIHYYTAAGTVSSYSPWGVSPTDRTCQALFTFGFPEEIVSVEPLEAYIAVNAYQAYSGGTEADIPLVLQKFGPMVTVTYASGRRENKIMPWGNASPAAGYTVIQHDGAGGYVPIDAAHPYDPTGVISPDRAQPDYRISQDYSWEEPDGAGGTVTRVFPIPVQVALDVQEIHLLGFTSEHLARAYPIDSFLPTLTAGAFGLELPVLARVVTDIPPGNTSLLMPVPGWRAANESSPAKWPTASGMNQLYADGSTTGDVYWPVVDDLAALNPAKHVGTYSFEMAAGNGGAATLFTQAGVGREFPWLAAPPDGTEIDGKLVYEMPKATRTLAETADFSDTTRYQAAYLSTAEGADSAPVLTLGVARVGAANMAAGTEFRVLMPDGREILPDWFGAFGEYTQTYVTAPPPSSFQLIFDTGRIDIGDYTAEREALRRHINLGGYFYIAVNEDVATKTWSEFMPVYVPPRENRHLGDAVYNFIGVNANLFHYPGAMSNTVTVPQGVYNPVDERGVPYYRDAAGEKIPAPTAFGLYTEQFGVGTTYDGLTGAQPGRMYTFTVEDSAWAPVSETTTDLTFDRYGPAPFAGGQVYGAYGRVANPDAHTATLRLQPPRDPALPDERIKVTYEGLSASVSMDGGGHLQLARYDNRTAGYTDRQEYEFVILNEGDADIYDLAVINHTFDAAVGGGHFVVTRPPAAFLPAGGRTTFTLTYIYGLRPNSAAITPGFPLEYLDHLYLTSSSRPQSELNPGDPDTYLATFDASFSVKTTAQHRILLNVTPPGGEMGVAGVIVGEERDNPNFPTRWEMNYAPGSHRAERDTVIYFTVKLADAMYAVADPTVTDAAGNTVPWSRYTGGTGTDGRAELEPGILVYFFTMPNYDVTIDIVFSEPLKSKLRLHDAVVYAGPDAVPVDDPGGLSRMEAYPIYQKRFTTAENPPGADPAPLDTTLMRLGRAGVRGMSPSVFHYLTVIPYEAEYIQIEVLLRQVLAIVPGNLPLTGVGVTMTMYDSDGNLKPVFVDGNPVADSKFYDNWAGETNPVSPPAPDVYDHHRSSPVVGPEPDKSVYVEITLTNVSPEDYGHYYFEIHRSPASPVVQYNYGNSPYGIIMNAKPDDVPDKAAALTAFVENQYRFDGLAADRIPDVLAGSEFLEVHYWSEAWVKPGGLYEPETGTGMTSLGPPAEYDPAVYDPVQNMDLNEYALFVQAGEAFDEPGLLALYDSSGRPVKLRAGQAGLNEEQVAVVTCSAEVTILDAAAPDLVARYSMPDPADSAMAGPVARRTALLDMGLHGQKGTANWWLAGAKVQKLDGTGAPLTDSGGGKVYEPLTAPFDLRPGVYTLVYTCPDFDGETPLTVTRPLVVLAPVGDVNGTGVADNGDRNDLRRRVGRPLGYDSAVTFYPSANLYRYRVCDVNNDRNINNIDANQLHDGPRNQYYLFTGYRPE